MTNNELEMNIAAVLDEGDPDDLVELSLDELRQHGINKHRQGWLAAVEAMERGDK